MNRRNFLAGAAVAPFVAPVVAHGHIPAIERVAESRLTIIWFRLDEHRIDVTTAGALAQLPEYIYSYYASFAVRLPCPIRRDDRFDLQFDGETCDRSTINYRIYDSAAVRDADPLIALIEGQEAPTFGGVPYMVFESIPLERFGNRIPFVGIVA